MNTRLLIAPIALFGLLHLAGCATPLPVGAVLPLAGGQYQSNVKGPDQASALKIFTADAGYTCYKGEKSSVGFGPPPAGKYVVISQVAKDKDGKVIKADNKNLEAGIAVGLRYLGLESKDAVETTTIFKCE